MDELIARARACVSAGDPVGAMSFCRQALEVDVRESRAWSLLKGLGASPDLVPGWLALASLAGRGGQLREAESCCHGVLSVDPGNAQAHLLMAAIRTQAGEPASALEHYRRCVPDGPGAGMIRHNMALLYRQLGDATGAERSYREALEASPGLSTSRLNLILLLREQRRFEEAMAQCRAGLARDPGSADLHLYLGLGYADTGRVDIAHAELGRALELAPRSPSVLRGVAHFYERQRMFAPAAERVRELLNIEPADAGDLVWLGDLWHAAGDGKAAEAAYREALEKEPVTPGAHFGLGNVMQQRCEYADAEAGYRAALAQRPAYAEAHSNLLMLLNYSEADNGEKLLAEHRSWARAQRPGARAMDRGPGRYGHRRLRVGYVSADFYEHAVMSFLQPVLEHHDRDRFEIHCISDTVHLDAKTRAIRALDVSWHDVRELNDDQLVDLVVGEQIDILVDLAGHTVGNRLKCFMQRAAPVQVSWLGYPNTTGLDEMDFRLTDAQADPAGRTERFHTEQLYRLDPLFLCYRPLAPAPDVTAPPCLERGYVTFGSFNTLAKITPRTLDLWATVLGQVPGSRLLLKCGAFDSEQVRNRFRRRIENVGLEPGRVDLLPPVGDYDAHLAAYGEVDIALDTFPYNGTTTTCEALWMGVPVVTRAGSMHAGRVGTSILQALALPECVAEDDAGFVAAAVRLASEPSGLPGFRESLRHRIMLSPLGDEAGFARKLEDAYLGMYRRLVG